MTDDFILNDSDLKRCESELARYRATPYTDAERRIVFGHDEIDAGIEIGFKAAWAYLSQFYNPEDENA